MNYGFVINNNDCIGCHACSTACKSENEVPLGVARTWVKSVETGLYPNVTRSFQVTRCNHCSNPPCVRICPTGAMYQRDDGIVEFNSDACIGCKGCLQACPYDAIHIDPESNTAAKCHYCAHRIDVGLEPACVVVCPEHAIIAGDLDDPSSEINRVLAENQVTVRKPEQGTSPKVFYINGHDVALTPTAIANPPQTFAWAEVKSAHGDGHAHIEPELSLPVIQKKADSGVALRTPQTQGLPQTGAIMIGQGKMAEQMTQIVYNFQHKIPWHWPVPAYLVTKGIATGLFMLLSLGLGLGLFAFESSTFVLGGFLSLVFMVLTTALLVYDLEKPERFLYILMRPQWRSWLAKGAVFLIGFSTLAGIWWVLEAGSYFEFWDASIASGVRSLFLWITLPLALGAAIYTAFLFGQAEGRDLWQSTLLPLHLIVQAFMAGSATLLVANLFLDLPTDIAGIVKTTFIVTLVIDVLITLLGEFGMPHASETAARAAHMISHGKYKNHFWLGSLVVGHILPFVLVLVSFTYGGALAGIACLIGLYLYEYAFVMAPQEVPNS